MYNSARGFLAQEFSDSPDVVEMIVGILAGFCDLHIHFQVGVKNHTQVSHWRHRCDLILPHMNEWYVYAFKLLFTSYKYTEDKAQYQNFFGLALQILRQGIYLHFYSSKYIVLTTISYICHLWHTTQQQHYFISHHIYSSSFVTLTWVHRGTSSIIRAQEHAGKTKKSGQILCTLDIS